MNKDEKISFSQFTFIALIHTNFEYVIKNTCLHFNILILTATLPFKLHREKKISLVVCFCKAFSTGQHLNLLLLLNLTYGLNLMLLDKNKNNLCLCHLTK